MAERRRPQGDREERRNALLFKLLLLSVLGVFLFAVYRGADAKDVPLEKIDKTLRAKTDIEKMQSCSARELKQFMGINIAEGDSFLYYKSKEALGVDEVLIVKVKNRTSLAALQDLAEARVKAQITAFESYGPQQVKLLRSAVIKTKGNYLFYCVSPKPDAYEEVLRDAI